VGAILEAKKQFSEVGCSPTLFSFCRPAKVYTNLLKLGGLSREASLN